MIFRLEAMCYGRGKFSAIFLYGTDCDTGEKVKLRVYDKKELCGLYPTRNNYYTEGARFFVGCRRLYPDVADAVFLCPMVEQSVWEEELHVIDEKTNGNAYDVVDDFLEDAKTRSNMTR